jgi:hypothetical protein
MPLFLALIAFAGVVGVLYWLVIFLIQASDDYASFLSYPLVRCLMRGGGQRCDGFS